MPLKSLYTSCPLKTKPWNFGIILFRTCDIFIKFAGLIPESTQDTTAVALPTKPFQHPYLRRFILMTSCRTKTETVSRMEKAEPSVSGVAVSLLVSGLSLTVDILHTFVCMVQCVMLTLRIWVLVYDWFVYRQIYLVWNVLPGMGITQVRWKTYSQANSQLSLKLLC